MSCAALAEQLPLFEGGGGIDMAELRRRRARLAALADSQATRRAYRSDWKDFRGWCAAAGRIALPASAETLGLYAVQVLGAGSVATCERRMAALARVHRLAGEEPQMTEAREVLRGARRERGARHPHAKRAVSVDELRRMLAAVPDGTRGRRDKALILVGFAGGFRRSELAALRMEDVSFEGRGMLIDVRRSKVDQEGHGRAVGIPRAEHADLCAVRALRVWLRRRGSGPGFVFCQVDRSDKAKPDERIDGAVVRDRVRRAAELAGVEAAGLAAHSLRAGCVTAAARAGAPVAAIMARTGHRSVGTVMQYVRPATAFDLDPLKGVL